ncbi:hypothetical protein ACFFX0_29620 [Citricoccus parietis]|uniref:Uncharacterized protein n=1 Tax=Citricoccus parietis TaxID=592307 RepID=A0ABV5G830_9MICC
MYRCMGMASTAMEISSLVTAGTVRVFPGRAPIIMKPSSAEGELWASASRNPGTYPSKVSQ